MKDLCEFVRSYTQVSDEDFQVITTYFRELRIQKGRYLIQCGQVVNAYYFVRTGGLRIYFDKGEQQVTGWIALERDFFTELGSYKSGTPTLFNIQAIDETDVLTIDKAQMETLYKKFPAWEQFGRLVWEDAFLKLTNAILSYQTMTAEERYLNMMRQSDLLQKVPLRELASYLGVTPTSLSRIRKNLK
jgi:CRP-like cAMP-binding protein